MGGQSSKGDLFVQIVRARVYVFEQQEEKGVSGGLRGCSPCDSSLLPGHRLVVASVNRKVQK